MTMHFGFGNSFNPGDYLSDKMPDRFDLTNLRPDTGIGQSIKPAFDFQSGLSFSSELPAFKRLFDSALSEDDVSDDDADTSFGFMTPFDLASLLNGPVADDSATSIDLQSHIGGCCCSDCGGMRREEDILTARDAAADGDTGDALGPNLAAPSPLTDLADFLTTDFWTQFGTVPRKYNLTDTGTNPKSGVLHYNVSGFINAGSAGSDSNGISAARADLVRDVLDVYSEVLGITFVETTSSDTNFTDIFFKDTDPGSAYANSAGFSDGIQYSWINISTDWSGGTSTYNDYTLQTIFHEMGHVLGLGHQGLYNGTGGYPQDADFDNDSWQATMMSYFSQTENTSINADFAFLQTPMAVDWIALQDIYGDQSFGGTNFGIGNAFLGDTVYGFNTNISSSVSNIWAEFSNYADVTASTIIDAGGIDTLDFSGYSATQLINLTPTSQNNTAASTSNIGGLTGNLTLAEGTIIENAIGGSGADTFFGNDADNILTGNAGNDVFNDSNGADTYFGGAGTDTVDFAGTFASYTFNVAGSFLEAVASATDLVENTIEFLAFDDQTLTFQEVVDSISGTPNTPPVANNDAYTVAEDVVLSGQNVLGNDTDADPGDTLTVSAVNGSSGSVGSQVTLSSGALLTLNADGSFVYDQNGVFDSLASGQTATDSFTYTASDGEDTDGATVTLTINGADEANQAPTAVNDAYTTGEASSVSGNLLTNDSDPESDPITLDAINGDTDGSVTLASGATVIFSSDGSFTYDPNGAFDGLYDGETASDSFTYEISDDQGGTDTATAAFTINGSGTPPGPTPVTVDFEGGSLIEDGFEVTGAGLSTYATGTVGTYSALQSSSNSPIVVERQDGDSFEFESATFTVFSFRSRTLEVEGFLDGVSVGTQSFNLSGFSETDLSLGSIFDEVDRVEMDTLGGWLFVDEMDFLV